MEIKSLYFNGLRECCYVVWDESLECVIIDPGFCNANEFDRLKKFVDDKHLKPVKILLTHCHFDHVLGLEDARLYWNIPVYFDRNEAGQLERAPRYSEMLGIRTKPFSGESIDVKDGDIISFGNSEFQAISTPGHTEGGVCYYCHKEGVIFTGDTLFAGSIGRTDHLGGNLEQLLRSITAKLLTLEGDVRVYPGHGSKTDISYERATNPFLQ